VNGTLNITGDVTSPTVSVGPASATASLTAGSVTAGKEFHLYNGTAVIGSGGMNGAGTGRVAVDAGLTLTVNGPMQQHGTLTVEGAVAAGDNPVSTTATGAINVGVTSPTASLTAGDVTANVFNLAGGSASVKNLYGTGSNATATLAAGTTFTMRSSNITGWKDITANTNVDAHGGAISASGTVTNAAGKSLMAGSLTAGTFLVNGTASVGNFDVAMAVVNGAMTLTGAVQSKTKELQIGVDGQLDIGKSSLLVDFTGLANPTATIRGYLKSGYNSGAWNGKGIVSGAAAAVYPTAVGYIDNQNDLSPPADGTQTVLLKYAFFGDSNLDGVVDVDNDFSGFLDGLNGVGTSWYYGDYNYDGVVDVDNDFSLFLDGLNLQGGVTLGEAGGMTTFAGVPEPATLGLMLLGGAAMLARRRRWK
jgi:hypothetical protein